MLFCLALHSLKYEENMRQLTAVSVRSVTPTRLNQITMFYEDLPVFISQYLYYEALQNKTKHVSHEEDVYILFEIKNEACGKI